MRHIARLDVGVDFALPIVACCVEGEVAAGDYVGRCAPIGTPTLCPKLMPAGATRMAAEADEFSPDNLTKADWSELEKLKDALETGGIERLAAQNRPSCRGASPRFSAARW